MVKTQSHVITYSHPFAAVTSSLWSKYDHHKYVQNIEILDRYVDEQGRLHSRRILSMGGNLPAVFARFVPVKLVHMLETAIVDPVAQTMTVETTNINCKSILDAQSRSRYTPSSDSVGSTKYEIEIAVSAFPRSEHADASVSPIFTRATSSDTAGIAAAADAAAEAAAPPLRQTKQASRNESAANSEWKLEIVTGHGGLAVSDDASIFARLQQGYIAGKMESWVTNKLLSNVCKGEKYIDGFCRRWRERRTMLCECSSSESTTFGDKADNSMFSIGGVGTQVEASVKARGRGAMCKWPEIKDGEGMGNGVKETVFKQLRLSRFLSRKLGVSS